MCKFFSIIIIFISSIFAQNNSANQDYFNIEKTSDEDEYENFTHSQRLGAIYLNFIPGLGSLVIMNDVTGAVIQWGLIGGGLLYYYNMVYKDDCPELDCIGAAFFSSVIVGIGALWGFLRPLFYNKPKPNNAAYLQSYGFNVAILPDKQDYFRVHLLYNKTF
ncbi:MAG: hypothetical protein LBH25_11180 [Fibromonadaceae bacterium]|jgi:hypothetical protein|nr:hypothetical protein [Fibromonadaceae bacterium]